MPGHPWYAVLQYFGRYFAGWQRQPDTRTVQGEFEGALERLAGSRIVTNAAGRTDTGVHALGQVVSFSLGREWEAGDLTRALNALLPDDVRVVRTATAPEGFNARKHATARRYRYVVGCDAAAFSPFRRPFEWALGKPLDQAALSMVVDVLVGEHDFRAFSSVGQRKPHYRCQVATAEWQARPKAEGFIFTIEADRFLHRMVRFLVGMSIDIALGRRATEDMARLLAGTDNAAASPPAPPEGLYLVSVTYPQLHKDGST